MDGNFFGQLSQEEIEKKARKWRTSQRKRFNEKRRTGGGAGIDMGKAVSFRSAVEERRGTVRGVKEYGGMLRNCDRGFVTRPVTIFYPLILPPVYFPELR